MKKALAAVALLVLVLVFAPIYGGEKARDTLDDFVTHLNQRAPDSARWLAYRQGWFKSQAVLQIDLSRHMGTPSGSEAPLVVPLQMQLNHGPIIVDEQVGIGWFEGHWLLDAKHEAWLAETVEVEGGGTFLSSPFKMNLAGVVEFYQRTRPFALNLGSAMLSIKGFDGRGTYRPFGPLDYQAELSSARLLSGSASYLVEGLQAAVTSELHRRLGPFAIPGELTANVQKIAVLASEDTLSQLADLELSAAFAVAEGGEAVADMSLQLGVGQAELYGDVVNDVSLDVAVQRVSIAFYNSVVELLQSEQSSGVGLKMLSLVSQELLPHSPEIRIESLAFSAPEGRLSLTGVVRVAEGVKPSANPFIVLRHMQADFDLAVDKLLAQRLVRLNAANRVDEQTFTSGEAMDGEQRDAAIDKLAREQLDTLLEQGLLVQENQRLISHLSFANGVATINGRRLALPL